MADSKRIKRSINWLISQGRFTSQKEIGERLGITNRSYLSQLVNTESPSEDFVNRFIEIAPEINPDWLLTGEGEMLKGSNTHFTDDFASGNPDANSRMIPFYDAETTGGYNGLVSSSANDAQLMGYIQPGGWFDGRETAAIRHVGNSMSEYPDGCVLAVREVTERRLLVPGRNYVIETSEYRVTKRIQRGSEPGFIALYSTNQEKYDDGRLVYEPFEVALEDIRRIFSVLGYIVNQSGEYRLIKQ